MVKWWGSPACNFKMSVRSQSERELPRLIKTLVSPIGDSGSDQCLCVCVFAPFYQITPVFRPSLTYSREFIHQQCRESTYEKPISHRSIVLNRYNQNPTMLLGLTTCKWFPHSSGMYHHWAVHHPNTCSRTNTELDWPLSQNLEYEQYWVRQTSLSEPQRISPTPSTVVSVTIEQ